jgi:putative ABC transport system ATP-binding protein
MLILENLHYAYPNHDPIVDGVSLHLLIGDRIMIMGPSGCGKTTLLRLMSGLLPLQQGKRKLNLAYQHEQSFIFQDNQLVDYLTVFENILLPVWCIQKKYPSHLQDEALALLDQFGLSGKDQVYPSQLSGGQQQRVGIVRALMSKPKIIFADEPTGHLDDKSTLQTIKGLTTYCKENLCSLVMVTHDHQLIPYVDRVYYMRNQQLIAKEHG